MFCYGRGMGLRERKKVETRAALSWAAIRLVVQHGYDNVRVEDIAAAANVSPRTFNNYFTSKAEAITARHLDRFLAMAAALRERPAGEPLWEALRAAVVPQFCGDPAAAEHPVEDPVAWSAGVRLMVATPAVQGELLRAGATAEAELAAVVAERTGTDATRDLYPNLVAAAVLAATNTATDLSTRTEPSVPVQDLLADALTRLAAGLSHP
jgi:AcrR family transcriptional regulator